MKKELIKEEIFKKHYDGWPILRFIDLPMDNIEPHDILDVERVEAYHTSDHGYNDHTILTIYRERLETDEEFNERKEEIEKRLKRSRKQRYDHYLKLKKEFEPEK